MNRFRTNLSVSANPVALNSKQPTSNAVWCSLNRKQWRTAHPIYVLGLINRCVGINEGKYRAKNKGEAVEDGAIQTACQQACPAQAITFGNLNDPESRIAQMHASKRVFFVLEEFNVKPNVAYLGRVRNPNPELTERSPGRHHG